MIAGDKVSAMVDGKERFAIIPGAELNFASELTRAGINVEIKRRDEVWRQAKPYAST